MARNVTVTLSNGEVLQYNGVPDDVTPDQVIARAKQDGGGADVVQVDGGASGAPAAPEAGAPEAVAPEAAPEEARTEVQPQALKGFEQELSQYYGSLGGAPLDAAKINELAQKYQLPPVTNIGEIEEFYKKYGMLNPRPRVDAPTAPPPKPVSWQDIATTVPKGGENVQRARAVAKGALFDFADEAEAALQMLASGEISGDEYSRIKSQINADYDAWAKANPEEAFGLETAGGIGASFIPGVGLVGRGVQAATRIGKIGSTGLRAAATGALSGALSGVGQADTMADIPGSVIENALLGGVTGGVAGKGFETAARGVARGRDAVMRRLGRETMTPSAEDRAVAEILYGATEGRTSPQRGVGATALSEKYGVPTPFGLSTPELTSLTEKVLAKPSAGREELARTLVETQTEAANRIAGQAEEALPGAQDYFDVEDAITASLRRIGNTDYQKAYAVGPIRDPQIESVVYNPELANIWQSAQRLARLQGRDLQMKMEPVLDAAGAVVGLKPTGDAIPDVEALDYFKRALDDKIDAGFRGKSDMGKGEAAALRDLRNQLVTRLDDLVPEYKAARAKYAGDMEVRDALRLGRELLTRKLRPQQLQREVAKMSDAEREALKSGALQAVLQPLEDTSTTRNFALNLRGIRGDSSSMQKLKLVMSPEEFKFFDRALRREAELFQRTSKVTGGSRTVPLAQGVAQIDDLIAGGKLDEAVNFILAGPQGRIASFARWVSRFNPNQEFGDKVYTKLSKVLASNDPDQLREVLDFLRKSDSYGRFMAAAQQQAAGRVAAVAGNVGPNVVEERTNALPPYVTVGQEQEELQKTLEAAQNAISAPVDEGTTGYENFGVPLGEQEDTGAAGVTFPDTGVPAVNAVLPRVMMQESGGDPNAVSPKGARGLMQVMGPTAVDPGMGVEPMRNNSPQENIRFGSQYLTALYNRYNGDMRAALMAYNWGLDNVDKWIAGGKRGKVPAETRNYVASIIGGSE